MARGPAQDDARLFAEDQLPALRAAVDDLAWLLGWGYATNSALELVGNRHDLRARQRTAVLRCTCTDAELEHRRNRRLRPSACAGRPLALDGFNLLIAVETALAGGVLLRGRDGVIRDLAGVHGSYRRGEHSRRAAEAVGEQLAAIEPESVGWLLDRPVSNSGRLKGMLAELAEARGWAWTVELDYDPDRRLVAFTHAGRGVAVSGDAWILDHAERHLDLAAEVIATRCPGAWILDLGGSMT